MVPPGMFSPKSFSSFFHIFLSPDCRKYSYSDLIALGGKEIFFCLTNDIYKFQSKFFILKTFTNSLIQYNFNYAFVFIFFFLYFNSFRVLLCQTPFPVWQHTYLILISCVDDHILTLTEFFFSSCSFEYQGDHSANTVKLLIDNFSFTTAVKVINCFCSAIRQHYTEPNA